MKLKVLENSIPCATPFVKTYKYFVETLSALRVDDLETKLVRIQQMRFDKFYENASDAVSL